ncbi:hypothetical protein V8D89_009927 [Ganoderma adspersum]
MADPAPEAPTPQRDPPRDPSSDVMPDYSAAAAVDYVAGLAAHLSVTEEQAREVAAASWQFEHQQAAQEARRLEEAERQRQDEEARHLRDEEELQRQEAEVRRTQEEEEHRREQELHQELHAHPADAVQEGPATPGQAAAVSPFVFPTIGQELVSTKTDYGITEYATHVLRDPTKLVNFWYFTHAGRKEARMLALASVAEDASAGLHGTLDPTTNTFSFSRVTAAGKPSKNALPDASLTLRQLSEVKQAFTKFAEQSGWDAAHIQAFVVLIMRLEAHDAPRRNPEFGERALIRYFADIRREYHTALALKAATIPDISVINEDRLDDILKEMTNAAAMKTLADVRRVTELRADARARIEQHSGRRHHGGRLWYQGGLLPDGQAEEFVEDFTFSLRDLSATSPRPPEDALYSYALLDMDSVSQQLGLLWEHEKDQPFSTAPEFTGLVWDLAAWQVALAQKKCDKYLAVLADFHARPTHTLQQIQSLHGKLLYMTLVVPACRPYLIQLEAAMAVTADHPHVPHAPPK